MKLNNILYIYILKPGYFILLDNVFFKSFIVIVILKTMVKLEFGGQT